MHNILLIDNDDKFRTIFKRIIERKFYTPYSGKLKVAEADSGVTGIEILKNLEPDIIFLNIDMPSINGFEFLSQIREIKDKVPIVIMTTHNEREFVEKVIAYNINGYLLKTNLTSQLIERIEKIFSQYDHSYF